MAQAVQAQHSLSAFDFECLAPPICAEMAPKKAGKPGAPKKELTEVQRSDIKQAFDIFDLDGSGAIDKKEFVSAMSAMGIDATDADIERIMHQADDEDATDENSGEVEFDEFLAFMTDKILNKNPLEDYERVWAMLDENKNGLLYFEDLQRECRDAGDETTDEELMEIIDIVGKGDGSISKEDFMDVMRQPGLC